MVTADDVRRVGIALPRTYERLVGGRWKLRVGQLVYVSFSRDEQRMGFGFPREQRESLIASDPDTFLWPATSDLRYRWVRCRLDRLDVGEMTELVTDAWRMCVPKMMHELPGLPTPAAAAWGAVDAGDLDAAVPLLHPYLHFDDGKVHLRGRHVLLAHLRDSPTPRPPTEVEIRDGQVYRWQR